MALKYAVKTLDEVAEAHRPCYRADEAGGFKLDLSGYESAEELRQGKERDHVARKAAEARLRELEAAQFNSTDADYKRAEASAMLAKIPEPLRAPAYGSPEYIDALAAYETEISAPYVAKLSEVAATRQSQIESMRADRDRAVLEHAATSLAARIARPGCVAVLLPHIRARLEGREEAGAFVVGVKDAASLDDLAEQLRNDPAFSQVIAGASPAEKALHAKRVAETLGVPAARQPLTRRQFEALSPAQRAEHVRAGTSILDS